MKLELLSNPLCPYVHRTAILLHEKDLPFERRHVDLKSKPDWFLALSPRSKVPVLVVDGRPIFESAAINEFLDEVKGPRLLAEDPLERALQRGWMEIANDLFTAQYRLVVAPSPDDIAVARKALAPVLARFEDGLASGFIDERGFGLLHAAAAPALFRFVLLEKHRGARLLADVPRVASWARRIAARPSVPGSVAEDFAETWLQNMAERGGQLTRRAS
jgi:glutathione S-transferase